MEGKNQISLLNTDLGTQFACCEEAKHLCRKSSMQRNIFPGELYLDRVSNSRCLCVSQAMMNPSIRCAPTNLPRSEATSSHRVWKANCVKHLCLNIIYYPGMNNIVIATVFKAVSMVFHIPIALVRPTLKSVHKQKLVCSVASHLYWQPSSSAHHLVHSQFQSKPGSRLRNTKMTWIPISTEDEI